MGLNSEGVRVVIAEDNEMLRDTLGLALQEAGYEIVGAAEDGLSAVETVLREARFLRGGETYRASCDEIGRAHV